MRDLRRVRRRLPDRRDRQQADPRRPDPAAQRAQEHRHGVPVLRRGLRADLPRRRGAQRDRLRRRARAAGLAEAPVREGPVRLGLHLLAPAAHDAADPPRRQLPQGPAVSRGAGRGQGSPQAGPRGRLRRGDAALPRGQLGGGARPRRRAPEGDPLRARLAGDRRLRLGEVLQRGGLPLPEADPGGLRHQQRRPLHAAVPRLERRRAVRGRRLGRGVDDLRRHHQLRRRDPRRHQHDRQPPRRVVVLQAGAPPRHEGGGGRRAARADRRPRRHLLPDQAGHGRRLLQRRDARDHPAGARGSGVHRAAHDQLLRARQARQGVSAGACCADLRHRGRHDPGGCAAVGRGGHRGRVLGDGHLSAHHRDRQRALPDRAVLDHRPGRASRHGAAPAARARTTCRAPPTRG